MIYNTNIHYPQIPLKNIKKLHQIQKNPQNPSLTTFYFQFLITIAWMTHAGFMLAAGQKVAATSYGLFIGQFMMWTYLLLWMRFYYVSYFRSGGKKYQQHKEKTNGVKAE